MTLLTVDFDLLMAIVIGLFALAGFLRGWWREGFTTILLLALVVLLTQPDILTKIVEFINNLLAIIGVITETGGDLSLATLQTAAVTAEPPIVLDPSNRNLYIMLLVGIILVSYFGSRLSLPGGSKLGLVYDPSTGARIAGGVLGAFNGFVVVNLIKEFVVGRLIPGTGISATAAAPDVLSVAVADVPSENVFSGVPLWLIIGFSVLVLGLILTNRLRPGGLQRIPPLGYKQITVTPKKEEKK